MYALRSDERRAVLRSLLDRDEPGDQVGWQLAEAQVGQAFATEDARSAVVVTQRFAILYGEADPAIGRFLDENIFVGTLQGALGHLDVRPSVAGVEHSALAENVRMLLMADRVEPYESFPTEVLHLRRVTADLDAAVRASLGWWVFEMWPRPSDAPHTICALTDDGVLLAHGGSYAVSPRFVEIAAWIDPIGSGAGLIAAGSQYVLREVLDGGRAISSAILVSNVGARRFAAGAGWRTVGETPVVSFAPPPPGSPRALRLDAHRRA